MSKTNIVEILTKFFISPVILKAGAYEGDRAPAPLYACPPETLRGAPMGEALIILHLLAFPFLRSGTVVYLGGGQ